MTRLSSAHSNTKWAGRPGQPLQTVLYNTGKLLSDFQTYLNNYLNNYICLQEKKLAWHSAIIIILCSRDVVQPNVQEHHSENRCSAVSKAQPEP